MYDEAMGADLCICVDELQHIRRIIVIKNLSNGKYLTMISQKLTIQVAGAADLAQLAKQSELEHTNFAEVSLICLFVFGMQTGSVEQLP